MNRSAIFATAHQSAKAAKTANGGDYIAYFSFYLKAAYAAAKNVTNQDDRTVINVGDTVVIEAEWTRDAELIVYTAEVIAMSPILTTNKATKARHIVKFDGQEDDEQAAKAAIYAALPNVKIKKFNIY
jgi:hypothetical protein